MSIRNRLAQLKGAPEPPPVETSTVRPRLKRLTRRSDTAITRAVQGTIIERSSGKVFVAETRFDPGAPGATAPSPDFLDTSAATLAWLVRNQDLAAIQASDTLFLDLETTGFGGAGVYPFLIGLAFYRDGVLVVQQLFMLGPSHESALLEHFIELTQTFRYLASFNGRTFDVHILEDRCIYHRLHSPVLSSPHFDVLFPSRQLWKTSFDNCKLTTLERKILGVQRGQDVESGLIPALYHHYVRSGETHGMAAIFKHNVQDLVSLVGLTAALLRSCTSGAGESDLRKRPRPSHDESVSLGLMHLRQGNAQIGMSCLDEALARGLESRLRATALRELSLACKRFGHHDRAVNLWEQMVSDYPSEPFAYEELAKWYEHTHRDAAQALAWTVKAASRFGQLPRLTRRLQRLQLRTRVVQLELW